VGGTDFKVCKASNPNVKPGDDPNNVTVNYTFSKTEGSSFELKSNTPPTAPVPYCGSGWYSLYTDAVVYLPDGTPVQVDATNPEPYEFLSGKTPPKINNVLLVNPALFKIAATAATQHAGAAAAAGTAAAAANTDNKNDVQVSAVAQTLSTTLAIKEAPKLPHISLQPRGAAAAAAASGDAAAAASG
ncbi:MAG: hypothetical protein ACXV5Q_08980, partial [Frankiaceae bacterium]